MVHGLLLQMHEACGDIDGGLRKAIEERGDPVDIPLQRGQVQADEVQFRMQLEQVVARRDLRLVRRPLGMRRHVVLRMLAEVGAVALDRHLPGRQPAVQRFGLVAHQHDAATFQAVEYRRQTRVVHHHGVAARVAQFHADVLPHLHGNRAVREGVVEPAQRGVGKARLVEAGHREGGREGDQVGVVVHQRDGRALLLGDSREIGVVDVDRQQADVVGARPGEELGQVAMQVDMDIDLGNAVEVVHRVVRGGGGAGHHRSTRRHERQQAPDHAVSPLSTASAASASGAPWQRAANSAAPTTGE